VASSREPPPSRSPQAEVAKAVANPEFRKRFAEPAVILAGCTPSETAAFLTAEITKFEKVITTAGMKADA